MYDTIVYLITLNNKIHENVMRFRQNKLHYNKKLKHFLVDFVYYY